VREGLNISERLWLEKRRGRKKDGQGPIESQLGNGPIESGMS